MVGGKVRWGILGTANIAAEKVIPAMQGASNAIAQAVASRDGARAEMFAEQHGVARALSSYESLIEGSDVDAVYVCLPNAFHAEWVLKSLACGKAVLCEKPMTVNSAEAIAVGEKAALVGRPVMEALMYRFHPQNVRSRALIESGALGHVEEVRAHMCFRLLDSVGRENIRLQSAMGGGALLDLGCYVVSATRMAFGEEPTGGVAMWDWSPTFSVDVGLAGALEYSERRYAPVSWSFRTGFGGGYTVVGSEATLEVPRAFIPGSVGQVPETLLITVGRSSERKEERFQATDQFVVMLEAFGRAVLGEEALLYDAEDHVRNMRAMELLRVAAGGSRESP